MKSVIFELVSSNLHLLSRYNFNFWPDCELIPTGNTILKRQECDVCAMTLKMPEIDSKDQSAHLCFYLLNAFYFLVLLFSRCIYTRHSGPMFLYSCYRFIVFPSNVYCQTMAFASEVSDRCWICNLWQLLSPNLILKFYCFQI